MIRVLGIETSCDETAIGIVDDGRTIRANIVASSQQFHAPYGGVIPEIAARVHVDVIWQVLDQALTEAGCMLEQIDAVAVTQGPGLPGALLVGLAFAKGLALVLNRPLIGVDHLAAHLYAAEMNDPELEPPYIGLLVSGGHTALCVVHADQRYELLGETKDDAAGEAFDKVARLLGLEYPGGPVIDRLARDGRRDAVAFLRASAKEGFDFSFSGLKTAVYQHVKHRVESSKLEVRSSKSEPSSNFPLRTSNSLESQDVANIAASFQEAAVDMLITKTLRALTRTGLKRLAIGGGVCANSRLRERLQEEAGTKKLHLTLPPVELCVDNGAMVAGLGALRLRCGGEAPLSMAIDPNLCLSS